MNLKETLENDLHEAMRRKDELTRDTLRIALSSIKLAEVESRKALDDAGVLSILQKEVKIRKETVGELQNTGRSDLVEKAKQEYEILSKYLPVQLSDEEIEQFAHEVIAQLSASNLSDMGKVMGFLVPKLSGKAAPERISKIVKNLLLNQ